MFPSGDDPFTKQRLFIPTSLKQQVLGLDEVDDRVWSLRELADRHAPTGEDRAYLP